MKLRTQILWLFGVIFLLFLGGLYWFASLSLRGLLVLLLAGLAAGGLLWWVLGKTLLARLARLNSDVARVGAEVNFSARAAVSGADELAEVGRTINHTLESLEHAHAVLEATFESTDAGFLTVDAAGRTINTNRCFFELWGITDKALAAAGDMGFQLLAAQASRPAHALERFRYWLSHPDEQGSDEFELQTDRTLECITRPQRLEDAAGKFVGRVWECRDITPRKQAEAVVSRQMGELITVRDIALAGADVGSEEQLVELATRIIGTNLYPADIFNIGLVDLDSGALHGLSSHYVRGDIAGVFFPAGRGITGRTVATGQTQTVPDVTRDPAYVEINSNTRSEICVPLKAGYRVIGFLNVESARLSAFGEPDERMLTILAGQLATALEKVRMAAEVQRLAITDSLTGLHNRRYFFATAQRELDLARRHRRPLCVIMLDLDHFKGVNDSYGHAVGDLMLKTVAGCCQKNLRETDLLGRYGGEEFAVLLPETTLAAAQEAAERLRLAIADLAVAVGPHTVTITASLGLAALDGTQPGLDRLLDCADHALYKAKATGRNCCCAWLDEQAVKPVPAN